MADNNFSLTFEQYLQFAEQSKSNPLARRIIPVLEGIEVFALPGYERYMGRYILSQKNVSEAINKHDSSCRRFLQANPPESILGKPFDAATFKVEGSIDISPA